MTKNLSIAVKEYPHTEFLREPTLDLNGRAVDTSFVHPIYKAFPPMVRELKYDVSELAIATFLQAQEAGKEIALLPIVMSGDFHHHSLTRWPGSEEIAPADLRGERVGVRAYSQTTGLWVRGILHEEFGVDARDVTWVTTEDAHVVEYVQPPNVERTEGKVLELMRNKNVVAAVLGPPALDEAEGPLVPIIPDWRAAEEAWGERHRTVPINHVLTVRRDLLQAEPETVAAVYNAVSQHIEERINADTSGSTRVRALRHGVTDEFVAGLEIAIEYALQQEVIRTPVTVDELLTDFSSLSGVDSVSRTA